MESRNAKFLENEFHSGIDYFKDITSKKYYYEVEPSWSSKSLIFIHTPQEQKGIRQTTTEIPQVVENDHLDQVVDQEHQDTVEQLVIDPVEQQDWSRR